MSQTARTLEVIWHTDGIFELVLERGDLSFTPGDCVALFDGEGRASRPYSLSSGTDEPVLRFLIRRMAGGEVSPYLSLRQPGDAVKLSPPFGWFRPGQAGTGTRAVFMATGTGIAPFLSYLRTCPQEPPMRLLYGVRQRGDAVAVDWLRQQCEVALAVSREAAADAHQGRITDLLADLPLGPGVHYYLCGLDAMIDEASRWLEQQGVALSCIHRECFFNAD